MGNKNTNVTESDLEKALAALEKEVSSSGSGRKDDLLQKALTGEISDEENAELRSLLGSEEDHELGKAVTSGLDTDAIRKSVQVSEFLGDFRDGTAYGLSAIAEAIEKSDARQHQFNVVLGRSLRALGDLAKSLDARMEALEATPVAGPRALAPTGPSAKPGAVEKSMRAGAEANQGPQYTRQDVVKGLTEMMAVSMKEGRNGHAKCGEDIQKAVARYEQQQSMSKAMAVELKEHLKKSAEG